MSTVSAWPALLLALAFATSLGVFAWLVLRARPLASGAAAGWDIGARLGRLPLWRTRAGPWIAALQRQAGDFDRPPEVWAARAAAAFGGGIVWGACMAGPAGAAAGSLLAAAPLAVLSGRARRRLAAVEREFPFAVDLLGLAVASGMHVEWAVRKIQPRLAEGPLKHELGRVLAERAVGQGWSEVLKGLTTRTGSAAVGRVAASLAQAEVTGMALAPLLERLAEDLRARRLEQAEERAARAPVRMLFPLVFCILPVVFVVLLGPILHRLL